MPTFTTHSIFLTLQGRPFEMLFKRNTFLYFNVRMGSLMLLTAFYGAFQSSSNFQINPAEIRGATISFKNLYALRKTCKKKTTRLAVVFIE